MPRPSKIDKLPPDVRAALNAWLRDPGITQQEATERTNLLLEDMEVDHRVSKSGVNRYSQRMEKVGRKLRESREIAQMWIGELGSQPAGELGKIMNEMLRELAFNTVGEMSEGDKAASPKFIKEMALALQRLESAANMNEDRERRIRAAQAKETAEEAVESLEATVQSEGLSEKTVAMWREKFLGVR